MNNCGYDELRTKTTFLKRASSVFLALALSFGILSQIPHAVTTTSMSITAIDVGQGDSILLKSKDDVMLIDAGLKTEVSKVVSILKAFGITKIDYLVATHPDSDHIGGIPDVFKAFDIEEFLLSPKTSSSAAYSNMMTAAVDEKCAVSVPSENDEFVVGDAKIDVLYCREAASNNDSSIVLKSDCGTKSALFMGDASSAIEAELISSDSDIDCDILKVGHHGSGTSTSAGFLAAATPSMAVISVGAGNSYNHPTQAALTRLSAQGTKIYRTDKSGNVTFNINNGTITASAAESVQNCLSAAIVATAKETYTYTGSNIKPSVSVKLNGETLVNTAAAPVYVTKSGSKYHYSSTCSGMKSPIKTTVSAAKSDGYTACSKCASTLPNGYTASYSDCKNCGKAKITITGTGDYSGGTTVKYYYIAPKSPTGFSSSAQTTSSITVKWSKSTGAEGYDIYNSTLSKHSLSSSSSLTIKDLSAGKSYKLYARAYKTIDGKKRYGSWSKAIVISTKPKATSIVSVSSKSKGFSLKWKAVGNTTGYQIQYSTSSKFTSPKYVTVKGASSVQKSMGGLAASKKYYIRVRSYRTVSGKNYYSSWSSVKALTTKK